jgi:hypothetical protein
LEDVMIALIGWGVFVVALLGGIAACIYWLRESNRWWARYEEMFIGREPEQ